MYNIIGKTTNYYKLLNLKSNCSEEEIIDAYSKLSSHWDPTKNRCNFAQERFTDISEAFYILSNKKLRKKYDILYKNKQKLNFDFSFKDALDVYEKFLTPNIDTLNNNIDTLNNNIDKFNNKKEEVYFDNNNKSKEDVNINNNIINELNIPHDILSHINSIHRNIPVTAEVHIISVDEMEPNFDGLFGLREILIFPSFG